MDPRFCVEKSVRRLVMLFVCGACYVFCFCGWLSMCVFIDFGTHLAEWWL